MSEITNVKNGTWIKPPEKFILGEDSVKITTNPNTGFWQKTYCGLKNDNAHAFVFETYEKYFSFYVKVKFDYKKRFDQCGVVIYQNSNNWFKASAEYENEKIQKLCSVVTNNGFSDLASQDINADIKELYFRLSRRHNDFLTEWSKDGKEFYRMRMFHLFQGCKKVSFGIYASSPLDSSFEAEFSNMRLTECVWEEYRTAITNY
jgi:regulation of enolase protein 1 (concanavalin A-like superfamily)